MAQKPKRPYLLRALYDWVVDSELTPYLLADVDSTSVRVPADYVNDGKIVLNVSPMAVRDFVIEDDSVSFSGRFGGRPFLVFLPMANVVAVYAKETGEGMMFEPEYEDASTQMVSAETGRDDAPKPGIGHLKVIK